MRPQSYLGSLIAPIANARRADFEQHKDEFKTIFGQPLDYYWSWHGFDFIMFAENFSLFDEKKTIAEMVIERFGAKANALIEKII